MIRFGMWSTLLLVGSLHGLLVAALLSTTRRNRVANRFLAALLVGVAAMITPYTLGYAGVYDAWPWMTFAPFYWQLAFGPLLYFHVRCLGEPVLPRGWWRHFVPAALQGAYYCIAFCLPLPLKWAWSDRAHAPFVAPALNAAALVSLAAYWWLAHRRYRRYQAWLEAHSARREDLRLGWIRGALWGVAAVAALNLGFKAVEVVRRPLDYFDYFPFYIALSLLTYYLGIEGWRHAGLVLPAMTAPAASGDAPPDTSVEPSRERAVPAERDWKALGEDWASRTAAAGWWREPDLDLATLARRLGTNAHYLSRALNDGLGLSFSAFVNRLRVEEACRRLGGDGGSDLLAVALEVGFGSKASFNRAFRAHAGTTPTAYREAARRKS